MTKHNKHYYEKGRNGWTSSSTLDNYENKINPKMFIPKEEIEMMKKTKYNFNWQLDKAVERIVKLLKEKNKAYGNSALEPANIFSQANAIDSLCARIDDKLMRIKNKGIYDATEDTILDLIGYLLLLSMAIENQKLEKDANTECMGNI